jgi:chromosome segregation ATPase
VKSSEIADSFQNEIKQIQEKINQGLGLKPLFEELKKLQDKFYKTEFVKEHRKSVWDNLDAAFKSIKDKKFGDGEQKHGGGGRVNSRFEGLMEAIHKMEISIKKDREEIAFQTKKINTTDGQLEMQIRQAKLKMIEERINSKEEKLKDMYKTKTELENKLASEKNREKQLEKNAKKEEIKESIKQKIAEDIKSAESERADHAEHLSQAASELNEDKARKKGKTKSAGILDSIADAVEETLDNLEETAEDVMDNVKAFAEVIEDKIEDAIDNLKKNDEVVEDPSRANQNTDEEKA